MLIRLAYPELSSSIGNPIGLPDPWCLRVDRENIKMPMLGPTVGQLSRLRPHTLDLQSIVEISPFLRGTRLG